MYRGGRPRALARAMNRVSSMLYSAGWLSPRRAVTLEVVGRRTGRVISFPVVVADKDGERYLVAMLGEEANWVRNVRAAGGAATIRRKGREAVRLEEVQPSQRAPMLRRYLAVAPGARPHADRSACPSRGLRAHRRPVPGISHPSRRSLAPSRDRGRCSPGEPWPSSASCSLGTTTPELCAMTVPDQERHRMRGPRGLPGLSGPDRTPGRPGPGPAPLVRLVPQARRQRGNSGGA